MVLSHLTMPKYYFYITKYYFYITKYYFEVSVRKLPIDTGHPLC